MKEQFKKIYLSEENSAAAADAYLSKLESAAKVEKQKELLQKMLHEPAPAFSLKNLNGETISLESLRGKVTVVDFWATWCEPCREEIPALQRLREKYASKNVEFVGIAVDSAAKVREYAKAMKITYPLLVGGLESIDLARDFGNKSGGLPYTIVIDNRAGVVLTHLGLIKEQDLDRKLAELAP
jgi:thiol-disulfide isomerase/thioredoxin